jgi:predicted ABC-type ATPase
LAAPRAPRIYVLAGVNGAGKSSVGGAMFRESGADYFNPDEAARALRERNPKLSAAQANAAAWQQGVLLLERAIGERLDFALETTLGGNTIPALLERAAAAGVEIFVWYAGLEGIERHVARVKSRVKKGGHDIPLADIRRRYEKSRLNLIHLLPKLAALRVYDNSVEADPARGLEPSPVLVLHVERGRIVGPANLAPTPPWAKPIVAAALAANKA